MNGEFPGPWRFDRFPWLIDMHNSKAPKNVGQKSAQAGFTETLLNRVFYFIDVKSQNVLYVLPNKTPDATDFTASRFNPALESSEYLSRMFSDVNNVGLKRAAGASLYIRGSRSRAGLKSIPVNLVILDEVDEMTADNIPLAWERLSGQMEKEIWMVSTPTIEGKGINAHYQKTTQEHFHFRCPGCSRLTELVFPECLEITADGIHDPRLMDTYIKCKECNKKLPHETKAEWLKDSLWVPTYADRPDRGFHINQLYSSTVPPHEIAEKALLAVSNAADEQELYNSKLGLTHTVAGAQITDAQINACKKGHRQPEGLSPVNWGQLSQDLGFDTRGCIITCGIDIGKFIHFVFECWKRYPTPGRNADPSLNAHPILIKADKCRDIEELYPLMDFYNPNMTVIDIGPERRLSYQFATKYMGRVKMCQYVEGISGRHFAARSEDAAKPIIDEPVVSVDRTSWLDLSLGRFRSGMIHLPNYIQPEYCDNIKALVRQPKKDKEGNIIYRYEHKDNEADHYAHARNYSEIAYPIALGGGEAEDIDIDM